MNVRYFAQGEVYLCGKRKDMAEENKYRLVEKYRRGREIFEVFLDKMHNKNYANDFEKKYITSIVNATDYHYFNEPIPLLKVYQALQYCEQTNHMIVLKLDAEYLKGNAQKTFRERNKHNIYLAGIAGSRVNSDMQPAYHIEYKRRSPLLLPLSLYVRCNP